MATRPDSPMSASSSVYLRQFEIVDCTSVLRSTKDASAEGIFAVAYDDREDHATRMTEGRLHFSIIISLFFCQCGHNLAVVSLYEG